jgi:hypothetical protein
MRKQYILIIPFALLLSSCITQFVPRIEEDKELLVVQGLITDQQETDTIKLSKSLPFGQLSEAHPVSGSQVSISDDLGNSFSLHEIKAGTYITDASGFKGVPGRHYTLHIRTNSLNGIRNYESSPVEMKAVPPIDSIYYDKVVVEAPSENFKGVDACQIYLDTHDPTDQCRYYRWDYSETWKLRILYDIPNQTCWVSDKSNAINIKSTAAFNESKIERAPINYITNATDRLKIRYSILVNQYSLNEDEYNYWAKIQNVAVQVGGLYDYIPASIPSNITCIENPGEKVLGYFSVSAKTSKRIFISGNFEGIINPYANCVTDTIYTDKPIGIDEYVWILVYHKCSIPCTPTFEITTHRECADCTTRGTIIKPDFWIDEKK